MNLKTMADLSFEENRELIGKEVLYTGDYTMSYFTCTIASLNVYRDRICVDLECREYDGRKEFDLSHVDIEYNGDERATFVLKSVHDDYVAERDRKEDNGNTEEKESNIINMFELKDEVEVKKQTPKFYTDNGQAGSKYDKDRTTKEAARLIRSELKKAIPECKFSVRMKRFSGGSSITVSLISAPFKAIKEGFGSRIEVNGIANHHMITEDARRVLLEAEKIANSYHFSDIDSMTDYFHANFYLHFEIKEKSPSV